MKTAIDKTCLHKLFRELEREWHSIYALMYGLPKEHCRIYRFYDHANHTEGCENPELNTFSVQEFSDRFDSFHPDDDFSICFSVHLERIDSDRAEEYTDDICLDSCNQATAGSIRESLAVFLESYCEKCQRENRPFGLTAEIIARFGFTPEDVAVLSPLLDCYNARAREMLRREYEALKRLDFLQKE